MSPDSKKAAVSDARKAGAKARAKAAKKESRAGKASKGHGKEAKAQGDSPAKSESKADTPDTDQPYQALAKPKLSADQKSALGVRRAKKAVQPRFRRHEWWRYKKLGGKHAVWRVPRGIHSKTRRHWGYRPPLVSIGYRGPEAVRGLHPSGFEEVLVHNPADLANVDKATQAARVGGTVGGRKAKLIQAEADKLGIRILNRRQS